MHGMTVGQHRLVAGTRHLVVEPHAHGRKHRRLRPDLEVVVVACGDAIRAPCFDDGQGQPLAFHVAIGHAGLAQEIRSAHLEPHQVVCVVHDPHFVGLSIAHTHARDAAAGGQRAATGAGCARVAAALSSRVACSGSGAWKMAEPATRIRAPAPTTRATLVRSTPPSTSTGALVLPARSRAARTSRSFASLRGMNVWPPNPGLTDITSTKSRSPAISSRATTGVDGFSTAPALTPSALMA